MSNELGKRAAKLFTPKPWKHEVKQRPGTGLNTGNDIDWCCKCGLVAGQLNKLDCTVPDPIDINWDNAMRLFREVFDKMHHGQLVRFAKDVLEMPWELEDRDTCTLKLLVIGYATMKGPKYVIEAAVKAKEAENETI